MIRQIIKYLKNHFYEYRIRNKYKYNKWVNVGKYSTARNIVLEIRNKTLSFIEDMRIKKNLYGKYTYSKSRPYPTLYSSIYAVLTRYLYRDIDNLSIRQRKEWINYIQSFQCNDGLFRDLTIKNEIAEKANWWGWRHLTLHAIMALTALGGLAKRKFRILEPLRDKNFLMKWLESRDWLNNTDFVSNEIQNRGVMLQYARDFHRENWADDAIKITFDFLDKKQDRETGLWGSRFDTPYYLLRGVQAGYHLWCLYSYDKRPMNYTDRIIDSCLSIQNKLGGFGVSLISSACEDIDSIGPLCHFYCMANYRKKDIEVALEKAIPWVLVNMNEDGGFVFRRTKSFEYGHQRMFSKVDESAMFPTWFRTLSLAYVGKTLPDSIVSEFNWQFIKCPGLQFWSD